MALVDSAISALPVLTPGMGLLEPAFPLGGMSVCRKRTTCKPAPVATAEFVSVADKAFDLSKPVTRQVQMGTQTAELAFAFPAVFRLGRGALTSSLQKATYLAAPPWCEDDEQSFRLVLKPSQHEGVESYRIELHMEGRCNKGFYQMAFQSVDDKFAFHVPAMAYIRSVAETNSFVPQSAVPFGEDFVLRVAVRMKPNDSVDGPLVNLCGCC
jgi:hypothetical protein